ncbi:hypothetical protein KM043_017657 [Ampulex compressa]|nr:hypothetical protein KM043_017657 [Ampulex compressa]
MLIDVLEEDSPDDNPTLTASKQYHRTCMDLEAISKNGIDPIKQILSKHGEWPMLWEKKEWNGNHTTWKNLETAYSKLTTESSFFGVSLVVKQNTFVLSVNPPKFLLPASTLASNDFHAVFKRNTYRDMIQKIVLEFAGHDISPAFHFAIGTDISEMLEFEINLAKIIVKSGTVSKNLHSVGEFQKYYDEKLKFSAFWDARGLPPPGRKAQKCIHRVIWVDEFRHLLGITNPDILNEFTPITTSTHHYYHDLCELLEKTSDKVIVNFIHWRLVKSLMPYTRGSAKEIWDDYHNKLEIANNKTQRGDRCLKCIEENEIKDILYHELLKRYFPEELDEGVFDVINAIVSETRRGFQRALNTRYQHMMQYFIKYKSPLYLKNLRNITQTPLEKVMFSVYEDSTSRFC